MTTQNRIGYLIPQFPGQTHIFFWREIKEIEARGTDISIFSTRMPPRGLISHSWSDEAIARTEYLGRPEIAGTAMAMARLPWGDLAGDIKREGMPFLRDLAICASGALRLIKSCRAQGICHVHVHSCARAALVAALASRMSDLTYSITLHGPMSDYGIGQPFKWRHAAFATIITRKLLAEVQDELGDDLPPSIAIQPMGVDIDRFSPDGPYVPPGPDAALRLFACGRLNIVKGHQDLMEAVKILKSQGRRVQLAIAGEDDDGGEGYRKVLEQKIIDLDLSDEVTLLGAISEADVRQYLRDAHAFVLASWHEPLGVAYMEAMACGVPTIGTASGGVPELINDGIDGRMVPPKSPDALAGAIADIIDDPELARTLSEGGRKRIETAFRSSIGAETILAEIAKAAR